MSTRTDRTTILLVAGAVAAWAVTVERMRGMDAATLFVAGYLAVWTVYGLAAYNFYRLVTAFDTGWLAWDERGPTSRARSSSQRVSTS